MDTMELKHVCKFCKKRFPCGRSLGGHIRSHLIKNSKNSRDVLNDEPEMSRSGSKPGYELRENPKKTDKAADLLNSSPSSWSIEHGSDLSHQKRNPGRRSCVLGGNNSNSSVSEVVEPEQEEVDIAMCLLKLSRDVGNDSVFGATDKTNTNRKSKNLEFAASGKLHNRSKMKEFEVSANGFASNDQSNKPSESRNSVSGARNNADKSKKVEPVASGHLQNGLNTKVQELSGNGFPSNDENNSQSKRKVGDVYTKNVSKMKEFEVYEDGSTLNDQTSNNQGLGFDETTLVLELLGNKSDNKRTKFECTTCNKVFHSYQALGGHRASHKKLLGVKSSPVSKLDDIANGDEVVQKYECVICFRVFPSGQALGGHKRSHLLATARNNNNKERSLIEKSSSPEIRDMLDLNLPLAPAEEETTTTITTSSSSNSLVGLIKPYWWVFSS